MVTGPAKNGHSCNQVQGRRLRHLTSGRGAASPHPQSPGCCQTLIAADTVILTVMPGTGMRPRRGCCMGVRASTCAPLTRPALGCMAQRHTRRGARKGEDAVHKCQQKTRGRREVADVLPLRKSFLKAVALSDVLLRVLTVVRLSHTNCPFLKPPASWCCGHTPSSSKFLSPSSQAGVSSHPHALPTPHRDRSNGARACGSTPYFPPEPSVRSSLPSFRPPQPSGHPHAQPVPD